MSYTVFDYQSKAALKRALKAGEKVSCYQPGLGESLENYTGMISLEGPHYPKPHRWYGQGVMKNGLLVSVS